MPTCQNGHQSGTDDWCEICGMRMTVPSSSYGTRPPSSSASASASSSASPASTSPGVSSRSPYGPEGSPYEPYEPYEPAATSAAELCPECGTPREGTELFCEECRYNFRTHTATTFVAPPPGPPGFPPYQRQESQLSRPSQVNRPAEPLPDASVTITSGSGDFLLDPPSTPVAAPAATSAPAAEHVAPVVQLPVREQGAESGRDPGPDPAASYTASSAASSADYSADYSAAPSSNGRAGRGTAWIAVVGADREYFTAMMNRSGPEAAALYFPAFSPEVQLPLIGNQITIGRRRQSTGAAPDIDLSRSPEDPGVSHQHAVLVQQPDGNWAVVDQDSTNGTTVNLGEDPIRPYTPVPLDEGDRIHVGAWTTITLRLV